MIARFEIPTQSCVLDPRHHDDRGDRARRAGRSRLPVDRRAPRRQRQLRHDAAAAAGGPRGRALAEARHGRRQRHVLRDRPGRCALGRRPPRRRSADRSKPAPTPSPASSSRCSSTPSSASSARSISTTASRSSAPASRITSAASCSACPMGCDVCYTNHAEADQDDMDTLLTLLGAAGVNFVMGVPGADDIMLNYQSTSFHDALYLREVLGLQARAGVRGRGWSAWGLPTRRGKAHRPSSPARPCSQHAGGSRPHDRRRTPGWHCGASPHARIGLGPLRLRPADPRGAGLLAGACAGPRRRQDADRLGADRKRAGSPRARDVAASPAPRPTAIPICAARISGAASIPPRARTSPRCAARPTPTSPSSSATDSPRRPSPPMPWPPSTALLPHVKQERMAPRTSASRQPGARRPLRRRRRVLQGPRRGDADRRAAGTVLARQPRRLPHLGTARRPQGRRAQLHFQHPRRRLRRRTKRLSRSPGCCARLSGAGSPGSVSRTRATTSSKPASAPKPSQAPDPEASRSPGAGIRAATLAPVITCSPPCCRTTGQSTELKPRCHACGDCRSKPGSPAQARRRA